MRLIQISDADLALIASALRVMHASIAVGFHVDADSIGWYDGQEVKLTDFEAVQGSDDLVELADTFASVVADPDDGRIHLCSH